MLVVRQLPSLVAMAELGIGLDLSYNSAGGCFAEAVSVLLDRV